MDFCKGDGTNPTTTFLHEWATWTFIYFPLEVRIIRLILEELIRTIYTWKIQFGLKLHETIVSFEIFPIKQSNAIINFPIDRQRKFIYRRINLQGNNLHSSNTISGEYRELVKELLKWNLIYVEHSGRELKLNTTNIRGFDVADKLAQIREQRINWSVVGRGGNTRRPVIRLRR